MNPEAMAKRVIDGDHGALAAAITAIDDHLDGYRDLVATLHRHESDSQVVGITGSPGTGKSTLVARIIEAYRRRDLSVGVIGVDPISPFSGGAILGDRVRMRSVRGDDGVFIRSLSTRGSLGGLSPAVDDVVTAYEAAGMDRILVETVGAGQNEVDIVKTADTVVIVVQPGQGDDVQLLKAGIVEIGDIYTVNKADLAGTDRAVRQLTQMLSESHTIRPDDTEWDPPVLTTTATGGEGIDELVARIADHSKYLHQTGKFDVRRRRRYETQLQRVIQTALSDRIEGHLAEADEQDGLIEAIRERRRDPYSIAEELVGKTCPPTPDERTR